MNFSVDFKNPFVIVFLFGTLLTFLINHFLEFIDFKARLKNGGELPEVLKSLPLANETFDTKKLKSICEYENQKYYEFIISSFCRLLLNLSLVLFGFFPFLLGLTCRIFGEPSGLSGTFTVFFFFFVFQGIPQSLLDLPFSLYSEFVIEKKFGFSKMTLKLWISDLIKEVFLSLILSAILIFAASVFLVHFSKSWWAILSAVLILFTFVMQIIYPKFIAPLFNKFTPLEDGEAKEKITALLKTCGFENGGLFVMDASKRSGHSNAYFSGFGKTKRIVLYDTLLKSLTPEELAAVLGHELGHFKLRHILKRLFVVIPLEFVFMFALFALSHFESLYSGFGFSFVTAQNLEQFLFSGLFLLLLVFNSVSELLSPLSNLSSRRQEYQADAFSAKILKDGSPLITALIKLNSENLVELIPPKLYVFWNYSHPTLVERIEHLTEASKKVEK